MLVSMSESNSSPHAVRDSTKPDDHLEEEDPMSNLFRAPLARSPSDEVPLGSSHFMRHHRPLAQTPKCVPSLAEVAQRKLVVGFERRPNSPLSSPASAEQVPGAASESTAGASPISG